MSELTWVLLAIAAVLIAALYLYGKWQERNSAPEVDEASSTDADSSAPVTARVAAARNMRHAPPRIEPTIGAIGIASESNLTAPEDPAVESGDESISTPSVGGWVEDPRLDLMLELRCVHSFDGVAALEARAQLDRLALPLPIHLAVWDTRVARWNLPDRFGFYSEMLIAVQLATRRSSLGEIDAARFVSAVQQIAVSIDADFDPPDAARIVHQAAELDQLCARFDVQITLTLESQQPWSDGLVEAAAREAQFVQVQPGRWERSGAPLLMTAVASPPIRLTITLDVPLASSEPAPLSVLFATARQLAVQLDARVIDDNGRLIEAGAQTAIEAELETLVREMRTAGIEPGSLRARRLYAE